ncbi:hypothetical protein ZHAS_00020640 [Anopheles sinensis]|uniref:Uncharacterized protein n=1 Tax=Anopheles sinensis TaxID=74873 RepID=A0A084WQB7_ANOSI|nr:hypothetical protein ZHAS_00020640 [Anopheles sinensis]
MLIVVEAAYQRDPAHATLLHKKRYCVNNTPASLQRVRAAKSTDLRLRHVGFAAAVLSNQFALSDRHRQAPAESPFINTQLVDSKSNASEIEGEKNEQPGVGEVALTRGVPVLAVPMGVGKTYVEDVVHE